MTRPHKASIKMLFKLAEKLLKPFVQSVEKTKEKQNAGGRNDGVHNDGGGQNNS